MTKIMNELPIAVHHKSGGDARMRCSGLSVALNGVAAGNFEMTGTTKFRVMLNTRSNLGMMALISYQSPVTAGNAEMIVQDLGFACDSVAEGTTVYWLLINPSDCQPMQGSQNDYLYVTLYG